MLSEKLEERLHNFIGGLVGGVASMTLCAPLDMARTRFQIQAFSKVNKQKYRGVIQSLATIFREEGFKGFFKGYSAAIVAAPLSLSLYFTTYHHLRDRLSHKLPNWNKTLTNGLAAGITGIICDAVTSPLWVARLRLQTQYLHCGEVVKYKGVFNTLDVILREEGVKAFYRGLVPSILGVSHVMLFFPLYEYLKTDIFTNNHHSNSVNVLLSSLIAKASASFLTYPNGVIRTRLQENPSLVDGLDKDQGFRRIIANTWQREGIRGFYAGFSMDLIRVLPVTAIVFMTYECTKEYFRNRRQRSAMYNLETAR